MTQEEISWYILRLAATTSSICLALVGWFTHYFREEVQRLAQQQAAIQRAKKDARFLLGLAARIPLFVGLGAIFLVGAGSLSVWVAIDATGLTSWSLPSVLLFLVAVGAPFLTGIILFISLFRDFLRSCRFVWESFTEWIHIAKPKRIVLPVPDVPEGTEFNVKPDSGRKARWNTSFNLLTEHSTEWGLGRGFMDDETNLRALRAYALLAFASMDSSNDERKIASEHDIELLEYKIQQMMDVVLDTVGAHRARLPVPLTNLAAAACNYAMEKD